MSGYTSLLARKQRLYGGVGFPLTDAAFLFPWQRAVTDWACRKGRSAIFADCGLGKTPMQLAWAQSVPGRVLILAPLCVADQTAEQAVSFGIEASYASDAAEARGKIVITNYERLHKFEPRDFAGVVLDESSILKAFDGKTRTALIAAFKDTPYRLCCTATPAPNDIAELSNHAEFLGLMRRNEFLATWFVHDDNGWRMKRHARRPFFRWMASWSVAIRVPSDIGYPDNGFILPPLHVHERVVGCDRPPDGFLFHGMAGRGIRGRMDARRASIDDRVAAAVDLSDRADPFILWCGLNAESDALAKALPDAAEVSGTDSHDEKRDAIMRFVHGETRVLITKPKIAGFGMNFQHCSEMAFVGIGDSYESYYQCIRRCWRFGQKRPVNATVLVSDAERVVVSNVLRKEREAAAFTSELVQEMRDFEREEIAS